MNTYSSAYSLTDTIAAVATPSGRGGIGVIRISGAKSRSILERMFIPSSRHFSGFVPWKLQHGRIVDGKGRTLDDALAVFMPSPNTFTGEDVVELHCHGGVSLLASVLEEVLTSARLAERGEFSRRAYLNGRMDLSQAEAVAELIDAPTAEAARLAVGKLDGLLGQRINALRDMLETLRSRICLAVDFPDDEVEPLPRSDFLRDVQNVSQSVQSLLSGFERTRCWREGVTVALAGAVNAGKSSLMNAFLGRNRAIVTDCPGTTRDFLEESVSLDGLSVRLVDTAGLRSEAPSDSIEAEGIRMGLSRVRSADVVILLIDGTLGLDGESFTKVRSLASELNPKSLILAWNKSDLVPAPASFFDGDDGIECASRCSLSAKQSDGVDELARLVRRIALKGEEEPSPDDVVPNKRQASALIEAQKHLSALAEDVERGIPYELCSVRLDEVSCTLDSVIGRGTADDVLNRIFETFCIGK